MSVVWITGAKGFIGRQLAKQLHSNSVEVAGIGHGVWRSEDAARWGVANWINGDIVPSNFDRLKAITGDPDVIYHLAGGSSVGPSIETPAEDFRRTVDSSMHLLEWVRNHSKRSRLVFASSAAIYGASHTKPIKETDEIIPFSPYGYHKRITELLFESYSRNYGLQTAVVRLFSVYGPELKKQLLWDLCNRFKQSPDVMELFGTGEEVRDWLHVDDAVRYLIHAASLAEAQGFIVNGGCGIATTVNDIVHRVRDAWKLDTIIKFNGKQREGDPHYLVADTSYGEEFEFLPQHEWPAGIDEYVNWYKNVVLSDLK